MDGLVEVSTEVLDLECGTAVPDGDEDLVDGVFGAFLVFEDGVGGVEQCTGMTVVDFVEGLLAAVFELEQEFLVGVYG